MSLSAENVVQENSGQTSTTSTSFNVTLPSGTAAGNTVIIIVTYAAGAFNPPAGTITDKVASAIAAYHESDVAAAKTTWTFTFTNGVPTNFLFTWYVAEMANVDVAPLDASASAGTAVTNGQTASTGTTAVNAGLSVVVFAAWAAGQTDATWSAQTNGFEEVAELTNGTGTGYPLTVARKFVDGATDTFESTATLATAQGSSTTNALIVAYRAADAPINAPLQMMAGFEWGTHGGISNTGAGSLLGYVLGPSGTWGTNYLVQAGSARNGGYGFRIVAAASSANAKVGNFGSNIQAVSVGFNVRVVSATGTVIVADIGGATNSAQLVYDAATTRFGVRLGSGGTITYQSGTTALNTWVWVDMRFRANTATWHVDWRLETGTNIYTDQTGVDLGGLSPISGIATLFLSAVATSQTMTVDYDDVVTSLFYAAYPLGPHQLRLLVPETTGATVSGTSTNFSKFTANGTLAAWASDAGALLDEVPPTVSASSDGVVQTTVAASDYMEFPMATYTLASDEIIAGVRMLCSEWGGTGSGTGTLGFRGWDGTTETTFFAASASYDADSLTAISGTYPLWKTAMWPSTNGWTQAELDAAAIRVGFSTDATPDMGVSAVYLEVAIRKAPTVRTLTIEDPISAHVDVIVNPYTSSTVSYVITNNDAIQTATFSYSVSGTPQTPVTVGPSSSSTLDIHAAAFGDISDIALTAS